MRARSIKYSQKELRFIKRNKILSRKDLTLLFNRKYGRDLSCENIKALCTRKGWGTGRTGRFEKGHIPDPKGYLTGPNRTSFKKGIVPANTKPMYSERINKYGYIEIKVPEKNPYTTAKTRYKLKHQWVWEQENGPIPEGFCLIFIDSDQQNCEIDNLGLVRRSELLQLNQLRYSEQPAEMKPAVMTLAKLIAKTNNRCRQGAA